MTMYGRKKNKEMTKKIAVWPSRCQSGGQDKTEDEIYETAQNNSAFSRYNIDQSFFCF